MRARNLEPLARSSISGWLRRFPSRMARRCQACDCKFPTTGPVIIAIFENTCGNLIPWRRYYENGQLWDEGAYQDGRKVGEWKTYDKSGALKQCKTFKLKN